MVPEDVIYDDDLSHLAFRVYAVLVRHGLDPESCFPSHGRIAQFTGVSERSIQRPLRELEERGWIIRTKRYLGSGARTSDGYHVRSKRVGERAPRVLERGAPRVGERVPPALNNAVNDSNVNESQRNENPPCPPSDAPPSSAANGTASDDAADSLFGAGDKSTKPKHDSTDRFDEFWQLWLDAKRYDDKPGTKRAWRKATRTTPAATVIDAAREYTTAGIETRYMKLPKTWLNAEAWNTPLPPRRRGVGEKPGFMGDDIRHLPSGDVTDEWLNT